MSSPFPADANLKNPVCVFCGSSPGKLPLFTKASQSVGEALAKAGIPLVYGGGRRGIMGVVSNSTLQAGGYVHGIVPRALVERAAEHTPAPGTAAAAPGKGVSGEGTGAEVLQAEEGGRMTMEVCGSMHERKLRMAKLSSGGFIVLPGGYGTFEEALEMTTWNQLGIHRLPILILNIGGFYTHMQAQFEAAVEAGFIAKENLSLVKLVNLEGEGGNGDEGRAGSGETQRLRRWRSGALAKMWATA
ncbi:hypothetical protein IAT38_000463 [Cryptococcus sp. DSM 104549]